MTVQAIDPLRAVLLHLQVSNFTLINMLLRWFGPMSEQRLCVSVLLFQVRSVVDFALVSS